MLARMQERVEEIHVASSIPISVWRMPFIRHLHKTSLVTVVLR